MARREEDPGQPPRTTFAMRLGDDERQRIARAATRQHLSLSAYIRRAALQAARRELAET